MTDPFRKQYRPLSDQEKATVDAIKTQAANLYDTMTAVGASRELSLAKTKLEETVFWATKHVTA